MSQFDDIQAAVFSTSEQVFGDEAVWTPSNTSISQTGLVLYNSPNDPISIGERDKYAYRPYNYSIEYYLGQFVGLKESVDSGIVETVLVRGVSLSIREVRTLYDGKTYIAYGELND